MADKPSTSAARKRAPRAASTTTKASTTAAGNKLAEQLGARAAGLAAQPAPAPARERPAAPRKAPPAARRGAAMPAEQPKPPAAYSARISLTTTPEMKRDLDMARVEDGVEATARIRAMIALWQEDTRLRARIDKLARNLR